MWMQDPVKRLLCPGSLAAASRQHEAQPDPKSGPETTSEDDIEIIEIKDGSHKALETELEPPASDTELLDALLEQTHHEVLTNLAIYEDAQPEINFNDWLAEQRKIAQSALAPASNASLQVTNPKIFETLQSRLFQALKETESYRYAEIELRRTFLELVRSKIPVLFEGQDWCRQIKLEWVTSCRSSTEVSALMEDSAVAKVVLKLYCKSDKTCVDLYDQLKLKKANRIFAMLKTVQKYRNNMKDRLKRCGPCKESVVDFWHLESVQVTKGGKEALDGEMKLVFERLVEEAREQFQVRNGQLRAAEEKKIGRRTESEEEKKAESVSSKPIAKVQPTMHEEPETSAQPEASTWKEVEKEVLIPQEASSGIQSPPQQAQAVSSTCCSAPQSSSANPPNPLLAELKERLQTQAREKAKVSEVSSMEVEQIKDSGGPIQTEEAPGSDSRTEAETPVSTASAEVTSTEKTETVSSSSAGPVESFEETEATEPPTPKEPSTSSIRNPELKRPRSRSPSEVSEAPATKKSVQSGSVSPTGPAVSASTSDKTPKTPARNHNSPTNSISIFIAETQIHFETCLENRQTTTTSLPTINLALNSQDQIVLPRPGLHKIPTLNVISELMKEDSVFYFFEARNQSKFFLEQILALYFHLQLIRPHALTPQHLSATPVRVAIPSALPSGGRQQLLTALKMAGFRTDPGSTLVQITTAMAIGLSGNLRQTGRSGHMIAAYQSSTSMEAALVHVTSSGEYHTKTVKSLNLNTTKFSRFKLEALIDPLEMANRANVNPRRARAIGRKFLLVDPGLRKAPNLKSSRFRIVRDPHFVVLRGLRWISEFCSVGISPKDLYKEKFPYSILIEKHTGDEIITEWLVHRDDETVAKNKDVTLNPGEILRIIASVGNRDQRFRRVVQASAEGQGGTRNLEQQPSVQVKVDNEGLIKLVIGPRDRRFIKDNVFYMYGDSQNAVAEVDRILRSKCYDF